MKRAALYARVSTGGQTVENQLRELRAVAERLGWSVVEEFVDHGISGAKGRDKRRVLGRPEMTRSLIEDMKALRVQGHSLRVIADRLGVGRGTVEKYTKGVEA